MDEMSRSEASKIWENLTIADNFIFQKVMRKKRLCKRFIEKILHIKIRKIMFPETEKGINVRRDSKSVRLDVYVEDDKGTLYDIEMQTTDYADPAEFPKRTRSTKASSTRNCGRPTSSSSAHSIPSTGTSANTPSARPARRMRRWRWATRRRKSF